MNDAYYISEWIDGAWLHGHKVMKQYENLGLDSRSAANGQCCVPGAF